MRPGCDLNPDQALRKNNVLACLATLLMILFFCCNSDQRWSRGHKARGQGQGHKKKIRGQGQGQPFRGQNLSRPRTRMLEAKARDQGHSRKCSPKKKVFKNFFQAISNSLAYPEFLIGEA